MLDYAELNKYFIWIIYLNLCFYPTQELSFQSSCGWLLRKKDIPNKSDSSQSSHLKKSRYENHWHARAMPCCKTIIYDDRLLPFHRFWGNNLIIQWTSYWMFLFLWNNLLIVPQLLRKWKFMNLQHLWNNLGPLSQFLNSKKSWKSRHIL